MSFQPYCYYRASNVPKKNKKSTLFGFITLFLILIFLSLLVSNRKALIASITNRGNTLSPLSNTQEKSYEVFGFAPYWTLDKLDNVDFSVLSTLAYFSLPINSDGSINTDNSGYVSFNSDQATTLFKKAHSKGTRVVATITQMDNDTILAFLDDNVAQKKAEENIVNAVVNRGIDGINVDFEYVGNPGEEYKTKFTTFVNSLSKKMHKRLPSSNVTVSVYATSVKYPKMYDIKSLAASTDGIFMMAYDFATTGSSEVIPTAPLYGYKDGKYWYDISTAVDDFIKVMPAQKLILGLPWYGYDYPVAQAGVKAPKDDGYYTYYWYRGRKYSRFISRPQAYAATYAKAQEDNNPTAQGWDDEGKVSWKAYQGDDGTRMIFLDDVKSLTIKYDFAKNKGLGGVGMWALGFDGGNTELWSLLQNEFGAKLADVRLP